MEVGKGSKGDVGDGKEDEEMTPRNGTDEISPTSAMTSMQSMTTCRIKSTRASAFWERQHQGRPQRVVFIRHGESEANVDRDITRHVQDHCLHLTHRGREQALDAGRRLREVIGSESVKFIVSPYVRTRETTNGILRAWNGEKIEVREDVRIREQEYGNFDSENMRDLHKEKKNFGAFYYRFPEGESPADCYDRASLFLESLYRSWEDNETQNLVIVGHGLMILVIVMRFFRYAVRDYDKLEGLKNCELVVLERSANDPKFDIAYTWAGGEEKKYGGLRIKEDAHDIEIWDGDPQAPMLSNVSGRKSSLEQGAKSSLERKDCYGKKHSGPTSSPAKPEESSVKKQRVYAVEAPTLPRLK